MGDHYHYDKHGNYTGKSSSTPPPGDDGSGCVPLMILVILYLVVKGCEYLKEIL
jgi:hypothetical protein